MPLYAILSNFTLGWCSGFTLSRWNTAARACCCISRGRFTLFTVISGCAIRAVTLGLMVVFALVAGSTTGMIGLIEAGPLEYHACGIEDAANR